MVTEKKIELLLSGKALGIARNGIKLKYVKISQRYTGYFEYATVTCNNRNRVNVGKTIILQTPVVEILGSTRRMPWDILSIEELPE